MATIDLDFRVNVDLPQHMTADLRRVLGVCNVGHDARGDYFDFPPPFSRLRIYNGERIRGGKRDQLRAALMFFSQTES